MSWKTSKGFVPSQERIAKLEAMPLIYGSTSSGAIGKYKTKKDGSKLASLTEGGYAVDIFLKKDEKNKRFIIDDNAVDSGKNQFQTDGKDVLLGILDSGEGSGSNIALGLLDDKDKVIFWYNGTWNIIEKHMQGSTVLIPQELALRVASRAEVSSNKVLTNLKTTKIESLKFESVSAKDLANLLNMNDLYSHWIHNNILHVMMNTDMRNGPYKLQRTEQDIFIKFGVNFINGNINKSGFELIKINGIDVSTANATFLNYVKEIKNAFKNWSGTYSEGGVADFGGGAVRVNVEIVRNEFPDNAEVNIVNTKSKNDISGQQSYVTGRNSWRIDNVGNMTLFNHQENYEIYIKDACHEFGHFLGLGDAYNGANATSEVETDDIMWEGTNVSSNDVEMLFLAVLKNKKQFFYSSEGQEISDAITH